MNKITYILDIERLLKVKLKSKYKSYDISKVFIEFSVNRDIILEPVCKISQSNNVHQNFKETLVISNFQGFVLRRFQNGSKNLINL